MEEHTLESVAPTKVLIWAKTYRELSTRHRETVCTGGCLEDGTPVRLYPVPLRYLPVAHQYRLYDWIEVPLRRNRDDPRPESFRTAKGIPPRVLHPASASNGWEARREIVFKRQDWHFDCLDALTELRRTRGTSLGMVRVRDIEEISVVDRDPEDRREHEKKLAQLRSSFDLFEGQDFQKDLAFIPWRFRIRWRCASPACGSHSGAVLDWGLAELPRREGPNAARKRLESIADLRTHDFRLFLGNLRNRPYVFSIVGLWYPMIAHQVRGTLFTP